MKNKLDKKVLSSIIIGIILATLTNVLADTVTKSENVYYEDNSGLSVNNVQAAIDGTCTKFNNQLTALQTTIINKIYPVGSIYISTNLSTVQQVNNTIGGTWEVYGSGRTLVGTGTGNDGKISKTFKIGETSGEYTHTLTIDEMPSHTHIQNSHTHTTSTYLTGYSGWNDSSIPANYYATTYNTLQYSGQGLSGKYALAHTGTTETATAVNQNSGGSKEHNNIQPYITVYMYKRIN